MTRRSKRLEAAHAGPTNGLLGLPSELLIHGVLAKLDQRELRACLCTSRALCGAVSSTEKLRLVIQGESGRSLPAARWAALRKLLTGTCTGRWPGLQLCFRPAAHACITPRYHSDTNNKTRAVWEALLDLPKGQLVSSPKGTPCCFAGITRLQLQNMTLPVLIHPAMVAALPNLRRLEFKYCSVHARPPAPAPQPAKKTAVPAGKKKADGKALAVKGTTRSTRSASRRGQSDVAAQPGLAEQFPSPAAEASTSAAGCTLVPWTSVQQLDINGMYQLVDWVSEQTARGLRELLPNLRVLTLLGWAPGASLLLEAWADQLTELHVEGYVSDPLLASQVLPRYTAVQVLRVHGYVLRHDAGLACLSTLHNLRELQLYEYSVRDRDMGPLLGLRRLTVLAVGQFRLTQDWSTGDAPWESLQVVSGHVQLSTWAHMPPLRRLKTPLRIGSAITDDLMPCTWLELPVGPEAEAITERAVARLTGTYGWAALRAPETLYYQLGPDAQDLFDDESSDEGEDAPPAAAPAPPPGTLSHALATSNGPNALVAALAALDVQHARVLSLAAPLVAASQTVVGVSGASVGPALVAALSARHKTALRQLVVVDSVAAWDSNSAWTALLTQLPLLRELDIFNDVNEEIPPLDLPEVLGMIHAVTHRWAEHRSDRRLLVCMFPPPLPRELLLQTAGDVLHTSAHLCLWEGERCVDIEHEDWWGLGLLVERNLCRCGMCSAVSMTDDYDLSF